MEPLTWPVAFAWTCALELPVYAVVLGRRFPRWWFAGVLSLALNTVTHPALWFVFPRFDPPAAWFLSAEGSVVAVEGLLAAAALRSRAPGRALALGFKASLAANVTSATFGLVWNALA